MFKIGKIISKYKNASLLILLIFISLFSITLSTGQSNFSPKKIGNSIFSILQIAVNSTGNFITGTFNSIGELKKLKEEQQILLLKVQKYQIRDRDFLEINQENKRLKEQLDFKDSSDFTLISAEIIAHNPGNIFTSFVIDKGTLQGVERNMPVLAFQDGFQGLVGKIMETSLLTSKISLIIDNTSYVAAKLLESRYNGLTNGLGSINGNLLMNYVSKNAYNSIKEGDLVISSGMKSIYPGGIYIGRVRNIEVPEWQTSLVLEIEPIIDFSKLEYVLILSGEETGE